MKLGEIPKYDNKCRHLSETEIQEKTATKTPYVIRFKVRIYSKFMFKIRMQCFMSINFFSVSGKNQLNAPYLLLPCINVLMYNKVFVYFVKTIPYVYRDLLKFYLFLELENQFPCQFGARKSIFMSKKTMYF